MMPLIDKDGFSYVSYKGKKKKKKTASSPSALNLTDFHNIIQSVQDELKYCDFTSQFCNDFQQVLQEWKSMDNCHTFRNNLTGTENFPNNEHNEIDIVCYGLGQFSSCPIARYQLGFLLYLKDFLKSTNVFIFDPQFSVEEQNYLSELQMIVLNVNEEAKRSVSSKTVLYMPHCDLPLYNNLLWANWSVNKLPYLAIIGNSFENYDIGNVKGDLQSRAKYVCLANRFVIEIKIRNNFQFTDIFNDLAIHYFQSSSFSDLESHIFMDVVEPVYSDDDIIKCC